MKKIHFATQGWIQHDLVGGGGALPALVPSCVVNVRHLLINLLDYRKVLLDYCIWIAIVVHSSLIIMLLLKLLYLIVSLILFCFIMKNSNPPEPPLARARGCAPPTKSGVCEFFLPDKRAWSPINLLWNLWTFLSLPQMTSTAWRSHTAQP
jgi:hypothetical protein